METDLTIEDFKFDICREFDCNEDFAKTRGRDCGGRFWCDTCLFYGEHKELNCEGEKQND